MEFDLLDDGDDDEHSGDSFVRVANTLLMPDELFH